MSRWLLLGWLALGCGESTRFDPGVPGATEVLVESRVELRSSYAVLADDDGYVVFWSGSAQEGLPESGSVFAARPGGTSIALNPGGNAQRLTATTVASGFLVCWDSEAYSGDEPRASGCLLLDHALDVVHDWRPSFGTVTKLARVGTQLYARTIPDTDPPPVQWRALDEAGEPAGEAIPLPCPEAHPMAWSDLGLVCLVPSDPLCGRYEDAPPDCTYAVELRDPDGALRFSVPEVAPFHYFGSVHVAARPDGILVAWTTSDGVSHAVPVAPDGSVGPQLDLPDIFLEGLHAVGGGYLVTWIGGLESPAHWPMLALISSVGAIARPAEVIEPQRDDFPFQYAPAAVGTSGDGVAVAWEGEVETPGAPSALLFRSLGQLP